MPNYDDLTADQILEKVMADGVVDADEVKALQIKLDRDWVVDHGEVELLFRVNQSLGDKAADCPEWTSFFVGNVARLLVMDLDTPGEIDEKEGDWLGGLLDQFSNNNTAERALLDELVKTASSISGSVASRIKS